MKRIYLDYAATTPVDPAVIRAMAPYFGEKFGNPGSLHSFGQEAIAAIDRSRETIAWAIGAEFREVIFTSSATEANNLALRGAVKAAFKKNIAHPRILISAIEHESILETAHALERDGVEVVTIPVDRRGIIDLEKLRAALGDGGGNGKTALVSVIYANNEIGTIQPITEIARIIKESGSGALLHTDAAQAFQFLDCNVGGGATMAALDVDLMTISSHKIYGPKGVAALYVRQRDSNQRTDKKRNRSPLDVLAPIVTGGGQEFGVRSGTENVPAIVGFAKAVELIDSASARTKESKRIAALRKKLWQGVKKICPKAEINGEGITAKNSLPNILNIYFPGHEAQDLLTRFDLAGLAVSSGSACRSRAFESSYVIEALGHSRERARASIRFSLGRPTTAAEINSALKIIQMQLFPQKFRMI